jgi:hypothetical protein
VALSACRTAEMGRASDATGGSGRRDAVSGLDAGMGLGAGTEFAASFARQLVTQVANVLGWDGSVYDRDATEFAAALYGELGRGSPVPRAAAVGRRALLRLPADNPPRGRHWHLARVYLGPRGGDALTASSKPSRPFHRERGYREFLDIRRGRVPVATAAEFVGRRRQAQRIFGAFREREGAGALIHGIGSLGKSSLAARIANRMPGHDTIVIFERYDALSVFDALKNALPERLQSEFDETWRQQVTKDTSKLRNALLDILEGPLRAADPGTRTKPVLLIVDDLERILETPEPGENRTPVKTSYHDVLAAIITAFRDADTTESRLLLTSRYTFGLTDASGDDLAARVVAVQLLPMDETQREKQMRAAAQLMAPRTVTAAPPRDTREALEYRIKRNLKKFQV